MQTKHDCGQCGAKDMTRFDGETFRVELHGDVTEVPSLAGWRCATCGEVTFDPESAARYASAGDDLVLKWRRQSGAEIRRIRNKLGLSQVEASELTGGGHNAFSRYERGEVVPMPSVLNLLKLLDRHPDLLKELKSA